MAPIWPAFSRPMCVQVFPASVVRYIPSPTEMFPRGHADPVPAYTTLTSEGATASDPTEPTPKKPSVTFVQV